MRRKWTLGLIGLGLVAATLIGVFVGLAGRDAIQTASAQATPTTAATTPASDPNAAWNGQGGVSVDGTGTVLVKPDVVRVVIGVQTRAATVKDTQQSAADQSQKLTTALKGAGIKDDDIKTSNYTIQPDYIYQDKQPPKLNGYIVTNQLAVTIRDISKAGEILDAAGANGATEISQISFELDNNADALKQARTAAMADARQKADQLATAGKFTVGNVVRVNETTAPVTPPVPYAADAGSRASVAQAPTVIEAGQYKVAVTVTVTYSIK